LQQVNGRRWSSPMAGVASQCSAASFEPSTSIQSRSTSEAIANIAPRLGAIHSAAPGSEAHDPAWGPTTRTFDGDGRRSTLKSVGRQGQLALDISFDAEAHSSLNAIVLPGCRAG